MKKFKLFQIIPLFAAILLVGCDRVEPGNVGIKVNKLGDDKGVGEVVGVGRYWTGWNTEVYIFPTFKPSSKTNSINSCSGPFLHLAAGGLRTSVTRGLPQ